jgi:hypothetical protein
MNEEQLTKYRSGYRVKSSKKCWLPEQAMFFVELPFTAW